MFPTEELIRPIHHPLERGGKESMLKKNNGPRALGLPIPFSMRKPMHCQDISILSYDFVGFGRVAVELEHFWLSFEKKILKSHANNNSVQEIFAHYSSNSQEESHA